MKLSDFIMLNEEEKKLAVLHEGVLISKRKILVVIGIAVAIIIGVYTGLFGMGL